MFRIGKEESAAVDRVIMSGELFRINTGAREVLNFEKELADKLGSKYSLCLTSGTAAITSILVAMGIGPGDEVIVPGYTFISTAIAVLTVGAIPVLAEIDESLTIDPADIERKVTPRTKAIIPVHICGFPCDMDAIMGIAKKYNLQVLEDACQADGGSYRGKRLGTIGTAGALSFNYYKIISAGEGGAVLTDDKELYERAIIYHDVGCEYWSYERVFEEQYFVGTQLRVSEITGAILRVQLTRLDGILADLRRIKKTITDSLAGSRLSFSRSNDPAGDCGTTLSFIFESEAAARAFSGKAGGWLPIDSNRHVYTNWAPILGKRGAYNRHMNPYEMEKNRDCLINTTPDACPATLDILSRTVYISLHSDWDEQKITGVTEACRSAVV